jgi:hypothetical protein
MPRTVTRRLSAEKLRELARTGAELALKRLRAEIIATERTSSRNPQTLAVRTSGSLPQQVGSRNHGRAGEPSVGSCTTNYRAA